ncbi:MAG TPA: hypothetical protein VGD78_20925 [Chthoniobacterales bacterium]
MLVPAAIPRWRTLPRHADELLELLYGEKKAEEPKLAPCGCLYPGECLVDGEHQTSACCIPQTLEAEQRKAQEDDFNVWWEASGCRLKLHRESAWEAWQAAHIQYSYTQ